MVNHYIKSVSLCGVLLVSLSACTYLIPEDPSVPRYNTILGEKHRPERNLNVPDAPMSDNGAAVGAFTGSANVQSRSVVAPVTVAEAPAPVIPVAESNLPPLPPVDAATQARADREINNGPQRQVPVENSFELAQSDIPSINSVPPRPPLTGSDAAQTRMGDVRRDLEHERATSRDLKSQLATDAANEPSMIGNAPDRVAPVENNVTAPLPLMPPAPPKAAPVSSIAPVPNFDLPAPPGTFPPPPPGAERIAMQEAPPAYPNELAPIRLTPPGGMPVASNAAPVPYALTPAPAARPTVASGSSFDPFASAPAQARASRATYASSDYLPASRYSTKRN